MRHCSLGWSVPLSRTVGGHCDLALAKTQWNYMFVLEISGTDFYGIFGISI